MTIQQWKDELTTSEILFDPNGTRYHDTYEIKIICNLTGEVLFSDFDIEGQANAERILKEARENMPDEEIIANAILAAVYHLDSSHEAKEPLTLLAQSLL